MGEQDQNFSLFNYVAEQSNEIERLEDTVASLKAEESKHGEELGDDAHQVWSGARIRRGLGCHRVGVAGWVACTCVPVLIATEGAG